MLTIRIDSAEDVPDQVTAVACEETKDGEESDSGAISQSTDRKRGSEWTKNVSGNLREFSCGACTSKEQ